METDRPAVMAWRRGERQRLIEARMRLPQETREAASRAIARALEPLLEGAQTVGFYWPFRGEPDLRPLMEALSARGAVCALPVVAEKGRPLVFRSWRQGEALERGVWNIPIPAQGRELVPQVAVAPVVGFDALNYRLGYGGGFYDRTLAAHPIRAIGVGYAMQRIATIHPQWHDVAMERVVTGQGAEAPLSQIT